MLSKFSHEPRKQHWNAAVQLLKYLCYTKNAKIIYNKTNDPLHCFVDASWAEDVNDRKSQSGYSFLLSGAVISWESRKQQVVATSSAEAEYIALTNAAKEAYYLRNLLEDLPLNFLVHC